MGSSLLVCCGVAIRGTLKVARQFPAAQVVINIEGWTLLLADIVSLGRGARSEVSKTVASPELTCRILG